jgi:hypothetical protein
VRRWRRARSRIDAVVSAAVCATVPSPHTRRAALRVVECAAARGRAATVAQIEAAVAADEVRRGAEFAPHYLPHALLAFGVPLPLHWRVDVRLAAYFDYDGAVRAYGRRVGTAGLHAEAAALSGDVAVVALPWR